MEPETRFSGITGTIIYLNEKGWGFINSHSIPFEKVYFHWSGLNSKKAPNFQKLEKGMTVKFNAHTKPDEDGKMRWKAINVEVINGQAETGRNSKG